MSLDEMARIERSLRRLRVFWRIWLPLMLMGAVLEFAFGHPVLGSVYSACALLSVYNVIKGMGS